MKKIKSKFLIKALLAAFSLALLSGCGKKSDNTEITTTEKLTTEETSTEADITTSNNNDPIISADYATTNELTNKDYTVEILADDSEYETEVMFNLSEPVTNLTFYWLTNLNVTEAGEFYFDAELFKNAGNFSANDKVLLQMAFVGDTANMGVSFIDSLGKQHNYAIEQSGFDGSVVLTESEFKLNEN